MPSDTQKRILDAAEELFAARGFGGASLRDIVAEAGVHLGAVNYHFGSKRQLFGAVLERRLGPLDAERLEALDALEAEARGRPVAVEALLEAIIDPPLRLVLGGGTGALWPRFAAQSRLEPGDHWERAGQVHRPVVERFLDAFRRALPDLAPQEVAYRYFFFVGALASALIDTRTLEAIGGLAGFRDDPEGVRARLVAFAAAGMRAPAPRRTVARTVR